MAKPKNEDIDALKSDVASFASSLGFSSVASPASGFNDVDFRKPGRLKPSKNNGKPQSFQQRKDAQKPEGKKNTVKLKPKQPFLTLDVHADAGDRKHEYNNLPALPLVKAGDLSLWYEDASELEKRVFGEGSVPINRVGLGNERLVEEKRQLGERLMWQYAKEYEASRGRSGDMKMLMASQRSGTAADKVSAFSFIIADNPVANLRSLDALLGMVTSKVGKRYAFTGFDALNELFISKLLPDRKLKALLQRPLNKIPETKDGYSLLLFWYWEDCLKHRYERFVLALEEASRDMLPSLKARALKTMYVLLKSKSEQERRLLMALVNKLGDPQNKNASNADFYLSNLLSDHPNMKAVVIDEVDTFLFRPNLGLRAKYHAVNFLSQIRLSHKGDGPKAAKRLIDVYFALFKVGLHGEYLKIYTSEESGKVEWKDLTLGALPSSFTWYKAYFDAPDGNNPVAIFLGSMGKGQAWVNGHHIGRYWTREAPKDGCQEKCDYRGAYNSDKCTTNCGQPTQTWYHIPRSWLNSSNNLLVLFEETGGNPFEISLGVREPRTVCAQVSESHSPPLRKWSNLDGRVSINDTTPEVRLQCEAGSIISKIDFASYGTPKGSCQQFSIGNCHAPNSASLVSTACEGKNSCFINVSNSVFGDPCRGTVKTLAVQATCISSSNIDTSHF